MTALLLLAVTALLVVQFRIPGRLAPEPSADVDSLAAATIVRQPDLDIAAPFDERPRPVTTDTPDQARERPAPPARTSFALGVTTAALAQNWYTPWRRSDLREVDQFESAAKQAAGIVMWFADWQHSTFSLAQAAEVSARGATPEISWEPWDARKGRGSYQPAYRLQTIIRGRHDAYVRRFALRVKAYGGPVRLRFAHEMNGTWYPWAERSRGNRAGEYVQAWRHVHAIFDQLGVENVTWIWSPVAGRVRPGQYPGDRWVDSVAVSGFNGGPKLFSGKWKTFRAAFLRPLQALRRLAPTKPVELSEIGSTENGGDKAAWIRGAFEEIEKRPYITGLIWFNLRKETDWRIDSSRRSASAFAEGVASLAAKDPADAGSSYERPGTARAPHRTGVQGGGSELTARVQADEGTAWPSSRAASEPPP